MQMRPQEKDIIANIVGEKSSRIREGKKRSSARIAVEISGGTPTWSWWIVEQIMSVPVTIAERHLLVMGRRKESIVRMTVIAQTDLEVERGENTRSTYQ